MSQRLFLFVQFEFPWPLGPPDGRYLMRSDTDGEPEQVIVLSTLNSRGLPTTRPQTLRVGPLSRAAARRRRTVSAEPEPARTSSVRATIVDPVSLSAERQARAWLADLVPGRDVPAAVTVLNRVLHAQRIAAADPYVREVSVGQASTIRAGWGEGEQVADGLWLHAIELSPAAVREGAARLAGEGRGRAAALRPHERLARLLGAHEHPLLCEEFALRARLDLDQGRPVHAALELERAYAAALHELADQSAGDLPLRVSELASLEARVIEAAQSALPRVDADSDPDARADVEHPEEPPPAHVSELDEDALEHALQRLEAALRARTLAHEARGR